MHQYESYFHHQEDGNICQNEAEQLLSKTSLPNVVYTDQDVQLRAFLKYGFKLN